MPELSERAKVILRIIVLFLVAGAIGLGLWFLFFASKPAVTPTPTPSDTANGGGSSLPSSGGSTGGSTGGTGGTGGTGALPSSPTANGGKTSTFTLTTSAIDAPTVTASGTVAYYDPGDGHFYTIDKNGDAALLSQAQFPSAESVTLSADATEAVVEFPDGSNVAYDFKQSKQTSMPAHWEDFSFSGDGSQIATKSIANDPSARALVVTSADGSSTHVVAALGDNDQLVDVNWSPDGSILGFSRTGAAGSSFGQQEMYLLDQNGQASGVLILSGTDFDAVWSPDSNNLIYSVADATADYRATLWYADKDGDRKGAARKSIPLQTLAEKCTFASTSVAYCAVPTTMPPGGGSSKELITAPDNLYKIELPSLRVSLSAIPAVTTKMFHLSVNPAGDTLYYTDEVGRLSYLRLK